jgi:hypothetical protein
MHNIWYFKIQENFFKEILYIELVIYNMHNFKKENLVI